MLTPSAAQANQTTQQAAQPATQAVEKTADVANAQVAQFKSIGGQIDPFLIEKTDGYRRYCIEGVAIFNSCISRANCASSASGDGKTKRQPA